MFLKILQYSQENICVGVSFSVTGLESFQNTYFEEPLQTAASKEYVIQVTDSD